MERRAEVAQWLFELGVNGVDDEFTPVGGDDPDLHTGRLPTGEIVTALVIAPHLINKGKVIVREIRSTGR